jgi:hypothetical protein
MVQEEKLAQVAYNFLPRERRGQGVLRFYPFYALPEVWSDGAPRAVLCFEAESLVAQRYLRTATPPARHRLQPLYTRTRIIRFGRRWTIYRALPTSSSMRLFPAATQRLT